MPRTVLQEIYSHDRKHRVLIVQRESGVFGFEEEYFSDAPLERCWCAYSQQPFAICDTPETALREAKGRVKWLGAITA